MAEAVGKREQKKLLAKNTIVETAIKQFAERGFQATSVADIMKAAHMGLGTFYNYFESKDQLLHCLLDNLAIQLQQRLQELVAEQESRAEILRQMVLMAARLVDSNKYVLPLFLSAGTRQEQPAGEKGRTASLRCNEANVGEAPQAHGPAFMAMFLKLVREGQASGEFRQDVSAEIITEMFHSLFQAAAFSSLPLSFEENIAMKLKLIIDGICTAPAPSRKTV